jgi:hypothetical protein
MKELGNGMMFAERCLRTAEFHLSFLSFLLLLVFFASSTYPSIGILTFRIRWRLLVCILCSTTPEGPFNVLATLRNVGGSLLLICAAKW